MAIKRWLLCSFMALIFFMHRAKADSSHTNNYNDDKAFFRLPSQFSPALVRFSRMALSPYDFFVADATHWFVNVAKGHKSLTTPEVEFDFAFRNRQTINNKFGFLCSGEKTCYFTTPISISHPVLFYFLWEPQCSPARLFFSSFGDKPSVFSSPSLPLFSFSLHYFHSCVKMRKKGKNCLRTFKKTPFSVYVSRFSWLHFFSHFPPFHQRTYVRLPRSRSCVRCNMVLTLFSPYCTLYKQAFLLVRLSGAPSLRHVSSFDVFFHTQRKEEDPPFFIR